MTAVIDDKELALAIEHPRGTERRRLLPYRAALQSPAAYAALAEGDRDVIVRWAEIRRLIAESAGVDNDPRNLVDPLIPVERLRALVIEGERIAAGSSTGATVAPADEGDLVSAVARIRGSRG